MGGLERAGPPAPTGHRRCPEIISNNDISMTKMVAMGGLGTTATYPHRTSPCD